MDKIALGGGCHWCTEAVFQSLKGVTEVAQGYVASNAEHAGFSEAVIVHFNPKALPLEVLIDVHLQTHKSTSNHSMRSKYRSAIYTYSEMQHQEALRILQELQAQFALPIITKVMPFKAFKASRDALQNYYYNDPKKPFCERFITPKLNLLLEQFSKHTKTTTLKYLQDESHKT